MFGFRNAQGRSRADPLHTRRTAAEWYRELPALDVLGRQQMLVDALDAMRHANPSLDTDRIAAILFLDAAAEPDRARLLRWYFDNLGGSARLAERFWQTSIELNHGFINAYRAAAATVAARHEDRRWQPLVPPVFARLVRCHGIDARLRMFRSEPWIPGKWAQLHQVFLQAAALGVERTPCALDSESPLAPRFTVEHEYIHVLLLLRLNTGNLLPAELEWASAHIRTLSAALALEATPATPDGFYIDLAGTAGLIRRTGSDVGVQVGYLDTSALLAQLDQSIVALRAPAATAGGTPDPLRHDRIAILERIRPVLAPRKHTELRRHPRTPVDVATDIRIGLARITRDLAIAPVAAAMPADAPAARDAPTGTDVRRPDPRVFRRPPAPTVATPPRASAATAEAIARALEVAEEIEILPLPADDEPPPQPPAARAPEPARAPVEDSPWRVKDRSAAGCRIAAPGSVEHGLSLGALVALWSADVNAWTLGVVRRLTRSPNDQIEAGMSVIAEHVVPVSLHTQRHAHDELGVVVDGVDASTVGARFSGLYLKPLAPADNAPTLRTLIIPTTQHVEGRSLILTTARSIYAVTLRRLIDQRADWSWVTIEVAARAPVAEG